MIPLGADGFHHLGIASRRLEVAVSSFGSLGYLREGETVEDQLQGVRIQFMVGAGPRLEILEPLGSDSPLTPWIRSAPTVGYHLGYEVDHFEAATESLTRSGLRLVREPLPAVAFGGRRVGFWATRSHFLVELIEQAKQVRESPLTGVP